MRIDKNFLEIKRRNSWGNLAEAVFLKDLEQYRLIFFKDRDFCEEFWNHAKNIEEYKLNIREDRGSLWFLSSFFEKEVIEREMRGNYGIKF